MVKRCCAVILLLCASLGLPLAAMEPGTDRPGSDYRDFDLDQADPAQCAMACDGDAQCAAWTYVQPGVQGDSARCWLKNQVPDPVASDCCISGLTDNGGWPLEAATDRPGSDYRDFDLGQANPRLCEAACRDEAQCVAYTFVRPGVQGDTARCWLKDQVPDPQPSDCCDSGVRPD
ncbi:MAG: PAN domain-containing protein [Xanthomonadales bacterium]|nr:PAN domain-containing protein [Xanthomonadales bacterium]